MKFSAWWHGKSGRAKTIVILATLLILQIGLCFATPQYVYRFGATIPSNYDEPMWTLNLMLWQALLCVVTLLLLALAGLGWLPGLGSNRKT